MSKNRGLSALQKFWAEWVGAQVTRLSNRWGTGARPIDEDIKHNLRSLRARSREQAQNNDWVRRFISLVQQNVVGDTGVILQAKAVTPQGQPDANANTAVEEAWRDWGRFGSPDVSGGMSWRQVQALVLATVARDGECLVRTVREWDGNGYRFALELLDPEYLDTQYNSTATNGNAIQMGVELNSWRRPVAYHFTSNDKTAESYYSSNGKRYLRIASEDIYHVYLPEWVMQSRGVPWTATSLMTLKQLDGYNESELVAARMSASKVGFFTQEDGGRFDGEGTDSEGNKVTSAEPGMLETLPPGVNFQAWDPQHPTTAYGDFVKSALRGISSGLGVSYNSLANDLEGVNYSSLRQGALEERATWKMLQAWFIESFVDRVYRDWLDSALAAGAIQFGGRRLNGQRRMEQLKRVRWQAVRWAWVDPQKEITAQEKAIQLGLRSRSEIIREQGRDPEDVWLEIQTERKRLAKLGIENEPAEAGFFTPEENDDDEAMNE